MRAARHFEAWESGSEPDWLAAQPTQPASIEQLQRLLDRFCVEYNQHRPHRSLPHHATPATAYAARPKALPGDRSGHSHDRVRRDRVDTGGKITLRYQGRLYSIGVGRTHARTRVLVLVQDLDIRIIHAATGELLRELVLDPASATKAPADHPDHPEMTTPEPAQRGFGSFRCPETSHW